LGFARKSDANQALSPKKLPCAGESGSRGTQREKSELNQKGGASPYEEGGLENGKGKKPLRHTLLAGRKIVPLLKSGKGRRSSFLENERLGKGVFYHEGKKRGTLIKKKRKSTAEKPSYEGGNVYLLRDEG